MPDVSDPVPASSSVPADVSSVLPAPLRRWWLTALVVLLPLWAMGLFTRVAWTPDEPRELAICAAMAQAMAGTPSGAGQIAVPTLGGEPFCEKPPLTYWLGGASLALVGRSVAAARIPNLLYAVLGVLAIGALAVALVRSAPAPSATPLARERAAALAGLGSAVAGGTMVLMWQVQVWLASDAPLLLGCCLALLGAWQALHAPHSRSRLGWWLLFHLGLIVGFLSKNIIGWLVPVAAVGCFALWQGRWRALLRWELHLGWFLHLLVLGPWIAAVAAQPEGAVHLRIFFWNNLVGRFLSDGGEHLWTVLFGASTSAVPLPTYHDGHRNWFGKYLLEAPGYLAPWSLVAVAAARQLEREALGRGTDVGRQTVARFLLAAVLPISLLLSLASTGRGIYLVIVLPGVAAALGWWLASADRWDRFDRWMAGLTAGLLGLLTLVLPIAGAVFPWFLQEEGWGLALAAAPIELALFAWLLVQVRGLWRRGQLLPALGLAAACAGAALLVAMLRIFPRIDPWQDLGPVVRQVQVAADLVPVVVYQPDETITAQLDWHAGLLLEPAADPVQANAAAARDPRTLILCKLDSDRIPPLMGERLTELARATGLRFLTPRPLAGDGPQAAELVAAGWTCWRRLEIPAGRRYGLFCRQDSLLVRDPLPQ